MSRRNRRPAQFDEPSLVPLADMLTNTVGIIVFILIFTVLTAGGAMIAKRLPMEREAHLDSAEYYICAKGKIYPLRRPLVEEVITAIKTADRETTTVAEFAQRVEGLSGQDDQLKLVVHSSGGLEFTCELLDSGGLAPGKLESATGFFRQDLDKLDSKKSAIIFWVRPDGIAAYRAAHELAEKRGFSCNWFPRDPDKAVTFGLGGSGRIQVQ